jgi:predicted patatin/cPLA2 family phospholipase
MNAQTKPDLSAAQRLLPFERVALVLQGGGALGAYQAGVYEALAESDVQPDWIAGISIGGINAAIYEFSRASMEEHWRAGYHDARRTLRHPEVLERPQNLEGLFTFDLAQDSRE